jgi:Bacterial Ig-like domain (group 2)
MSRPHLICWLLLVGAGHERDCRVATGPDGFCAAIRLEPRRTELPIGGTLQIKAPGLDCARRQNCPDCPGRGRVHWSSTAPDVATVDSNGLVRAERMGAADIHLTTDEAVPQRLASMHVVVKW